MIKQMSTPVHGVPKKCWTRGIINMSLRTLLYIYCGHIVRFDITPDANSVDMLIVAICPITEYKNIMYGRVTLTIA